MIGAIKFNIHKRVEGRGKLFCGRHRVFKKLANILTVYITHITSKTVTKPTYAHILNVFFQYHNYLCFK